MASVPTSSSIARHERVDAIMMMLGNNKQLTQDMKEDKEKRAILRDTRQTLTMELCKIAGLGVSDDGARRLKTAMDVYTYYIEKEGLECKWNFDARKKSAIVAAPWSNHMQKSVQDWRGPS